VALSYCSSGMDAGGRSIMSSEEAGGGVVVICRLTGICCKRCCRDETRRGLRVSVGVRYVLLWRGDVVGAEPHGALAREARPNAAMDAGAFAGIILHGERWSGFSSRKKDVEMAGAAEVDGMWLRSLINPLKRRRRCRPPRLQASFVIGTMV
jgi:hypothetical protein